MAKRKSARETTSMPGLTTEQIDRSISVVRGHKVLLDEQLAGFYGITTKALVQAFKRNIERFPEDFAFQLAGDEWDILRSQIVTSSFATHGGRRYAPYAFTEQGVAMLSSVLRRSTGRRGQHPDHAGLRPAAATAQRPQGTGRTAWK